MILPKNQDKLGLDLLGYLLELIAKKIISAVSLQFFETLAIYFEYFLSVRRLKSSTFSSFPLHLAQQTDFHLCLVCSNILTWLLTNFLLLKTPSVFLFFIEIYRKVKIVQNVAAFNF